MIFLVILISCTGFVSAQSAKMIRLPSGQDVYDLSGEWDALIEYYGQAAGYGTYSNVVKITQTGCSCPVTGQITIIGIILKDNPPQMCAPAGSEIVRGELEGNGFSKLEMVSGEGEAFPCKWHISHNGNEINIEAPNHGKMTLTRK